MVTSFLYLFCLYLTSFNLIQSASIPGNYSDSKHGIQMGKVIHGCDDAKTNLELDWDGSPLDYVCFHPKNPYPVKKTKSIRKCIDLPKDYFPQHFCMDKKLTYNVTLPTYGDHRPLWPVFGEYKYVPPQRWLHNIEHGAVVMLYHPCAHPSQVNRLRAYVRHCIRKHIITPYIHLSPDNPIALITWGCSLEMSYVKKQEVINFIKATALHGPEGDYPKEGQFTKNLIKIATVPNGSNYNDTQLCSLL
ncbi:uncharacterized protein LOC128393790 [Panonychus citri]|uniref:uncharacterized protein LOC128393790 n=1 Tax=Panonychus citri TaxID=50023 RepID=UPI002307676B|nr:uncharacterized protein LOC128393790 [Panonychus citri]XP_053209977.1 uncharacterized protein LOC128393790 [Panonychus citri]XP_053209978.1 uncharacterized protein LOC128393790 [Panonychus citri]